MLFRVLVLSLVLTLAASGCGGGEDPGSAADTSSATAEATTAAAAAEPSGDAIEIRVESTTDGSGETGTFTATGTIDDSGTFSTVDLKEPPYGLQQTFEGEKGTFVIHVGFKDISPALVTFNWDVTSGTGDYATLSAEGEGEHHFYEGKRFDGVYTGAAPP